MVAGELSGLPDAFASLRKECTRLVQLLTHWIIRHLVQRSLTYYYGTKYTHRLLSVLLNTAARWSNEQADLPLVLWM